MRIVATVAALLVVAGAMASQLAAKAPETPLLGVVWNGHAAAIAALDAATLEPAGGALPVKDVAAFGYSPDQTQVALGGTRAPVVQFDKLRCWLFGDFPW